MSTKVSIIVPVYNAEKYLEFCIESIINQSYSNIEILVVNDGSIDKSESIVQEFQKKDKRIKYYYQINSGPADARNTGLMHATGDYIAFIDADDKVEQNYILLLVKKMETSNSDLICSGYKDVSQFGIKIHSDFNLSDTNSAKRMLLTMCEGTGGVLWSKLFKRNLIEQHRLKLKSELFMCEDLVFVLEYASNCECFTYIDEFQYHYNRLNQNSISAKINIEYLENYLTVWKQIEKILFKSNIEKSTVKKIISRKIQSLIISLLELPENTYHTSYTLMTNLLNEPYIKAYKDKFTTVHYLYKPYIYFIKLNYLKMLVLYGIYFSKVKRIKRELIDRKKVIV
ncbi:glycosyl transferase [Salipaludibacillus keqinensis]|uniref:Glycosyl transferase n=1 Tax=Salipaludibacillus keqinensis TaxID=2045207 RepID=A0A323TN30_9BACI|nr:glycosyltransferase family 2 protein [Salipaludibacillus keqinensis]PYZ95077.1 glycosyl transferase [Salipaludibacillus keqinensis]